MNLKIFQLLSELSIYSFKWLVFFSQPKIVILNFRVSILHYILFELFQTTFSFLQMDLIFIYQIFIGLQFCLKHFLLLYFRC